MWETYHSGLNLKAYIIWFLLLLLFKLLNEFHTFLLFSSNTLRGRVQAENKIKTKRPRQRQLIIHQILKSVKFHDKFRGA